MLEKYGGDAVIHVSRADGHKEGFHGSFAGPMDELVKKLKRVDPHAEVLSSDKDETMMVVGGVLYDLRTTYYINIYLTDVSEIREMMAVMEPTAV